MTTPKPFTVRLPEKLRQMVKAEAAKQHRTFTAQLVAIIEHYFKTKKAK